MNEDRSKPGFQNKEKKNLLHDLEDLSDMLDDEHTEIEKELTQPYDLDDLPVLKSFVEDVPTLNEPLSGSPDESHVDDSFVDDDPLAISASVRQKREGKDQPDTAKPPQSAAPSPATPPPEVGRQDKSDNPFLPKSALDRLKNSGTPDQEQNKASQELRSLLKQRSLPNFSTNSKEYQALRNDASKMVNEVIKLFIPRIEAELRMRLEKEIDEYLNELRKNAKD